MKRILRLNLFYVHFKLRVQKVLKNEPLHEMFSRYQYWQKYNFMTSKLCVYILKTVLCIRFQHKLSCHGDITNDLARLNSTCDSFAMHFFFICWYSHIQANFFYLSCIRAPEKGNYKFLIKFILSLFLPPAKYKSV